MNIILGIIVLAFGIYKYKDTTQYDGFDAQYYKARGYGMVFLSLILGIALLFDLVQLW